MAGQRVQRKARVAGYIGPLRRIVRFGSKRISHK